MSIFFYDTVARAIGRRYTEDTISWLKPILPISILAMMTYIVSILYAMSL